jgi:hypothetical protein
MVAPVAAAGDIGAGGTTLRRDWLDDVTDIIDDIIEDLEDADSQVLTLDGPLADPAKGSVEGSLGRALESIDVLLDQQVYPIMANSHLGEVDDRIAPVLLSEYALDCLDLADNAYAEVLTGQGFDDAYVASQLLTIKHLITRAGPHSYRTKAGIADATAALPGES